MVASPGNFKEVTLILAFCNMSSSLSWRVLLNTKLVSKSLFWKSSWVSTFNVSSTTKSGAGFITSSMNASLSKSVWLIFNAVF